MVASYVRGGQDGFDACPASCESCWKTQRCANAVHNAARLCAQKRLQHSLGANYATVFSQSDLAAVWPPPAGRAGSGCSALQRHSGGAVQAWRSPCGVVRYSSNAASCRPCEAPLHSKGLRASGKSACRPQGAPDRNANTAQQPCYTVNDRPLTRGNARLPPPPPPPHYRCSCLLLVLASTQHPPHVPPPFPGPAAAATETPGNACVGQRAALLAYYTPAAAACLGWWRQQQALAAPPQVSCCGLVGRSLVLLHSQALSYPTQNESSLTYPAGDRYWRRHWHHSSRSRTRATAVAARTAATI